MRTSKASSIWRRLRSRGPHRFARRRLSATSGVKSMVRVRAAALGEGKGLTRRVSLLLGMLLAEDPDPRDCRAAARARDAVGDTEPRGFGAEQSPVEPRGTARRAVERTTGRGDSDFADECVPGAGGDRTAGGVVDAPRRGDPVGALRECDAGVDAD